MKENNKIWKAQFEDSWNSKRKKEIKKMSITKRINQINEIICIYNKNKEEINLLHDFNQNINSWTKEEKNIYNNSKNHLKDIYKKDMDIYINDKKLEFNTKYSSNERGKIKVKFIFHQLLITTSFMFYKCSSLESIDLSSFNTTNVTNMYNMFNDCFSLKRKYKIE